MKEFSRYGGNRPNQSSAMTAKEQQLTQLVNQMRPMLKSLTDGLQNKNEEIKRLKAQVEELTASNRELMASRQVNTQIVPCFRCDGRQTEKGRSDPCRRCKGTGRVNTQHEKFLLELIQSQIEKQIPIAAKQRELKEGKPLVEHHGVTCYFCKSNPLLGTRYLCLTCEQLNICQHCEL